MTLERRRQGRQRILSGAAQILDTGGMSDFTVDSLARNLRMSKSTLYKYFDSKDQVLVALVDKLCGATEEALSRFDARSSGTARVALDQAARILAEHAERFPGAIVLEAGALSTISSSRVARTRAALLECLAAVMTRGMRDGAFRTVEPRLAAGAFLAATEQAVLDATTGEVDISRGDAVRAVHRMICDGLLSG